MISTKKGVGVGQVFIFIIAALTFALIMIFGYKAINSFLKSGEQVEFVQFKTDLLTAVQKIYTEYGSVRIEEFYPPAAYKRVCFIDLDTSPSPEQLAELCAIDGRACTVWEESQGYDTENQNVFLTPPEPVQLKVYKIKMDGGYLCTDIINGKFELILQGKGDHTFLQIHERGSE